MGGLIKGTGLVAGAAAGCFAWGLAEAGMFTTRHVTLPALPPGGRDLRILHVSDIHLTSRQHRKLAFIRGLAELEPDVIVNTGDNFAEPAAIEPLMAAFGALRSVPGVFVFGSNDYFAPQFKNPVRYLVKGRSRIQVEPRRLPTDELRWRMLEVGWQDLTHETARLEVAGRRLAFRGTDDAHLERDDYSRVAGPAVADADLNVGVTHAPYLRLLDAMTADGMDLILAGHTHGGQVCVPGHGALITNCDIDADRVKGLSTHVSEGRTANLHVSAGIGTSPFAPYRFACRPEATLLTLTARRG